MNAGTIRRMRGGSWRQGAAAPRLANEDSATSRRSTVMRLCPGQPAYMRVTRRRSALRHPSSLPSRFRHPPSLTTVVPYEDPAAHEGDPETHPRPQYAEVILSAAKDAGGPFSRGPCPRPASSPPPSASAPRTPARVAPPNLAPARSRGARVRPSTSTEEPLWSAPSGRALADPRTTTSTRGSARSTETRRSAFTLQFRSTAYSCVGSGDRE
jgi:hypothetical protein